jgi:chromosome segregation ATPase
MTLSQLSNSLRFGDDSFEKVRGMIQTMIDRLEKQAAEESTHKQWCDKETSTSTDSRNKLQSRSENLAARIAKASATAAKLGQDISTLQNEITDMNASEQSATTQRNNEHQAFESLMADCEQGQDSIAQAIAVLREYYSKPANALMQTGAGPEFAGPIFEAGYQKQNSGGVIGILEVSQSDFARMEAEGRADEDAAQRAYDQLKQQNAVSRSAKTADINAKQSEKVSLERLTGDLNGDHDSTNGELDAVLKYLDELKSSCEYQPVSFEDRAAKREQEIASLHEALEILSGDIDSADAFLQSIKQHTQ